MGAMHLIPTPRSVSEMSGAFILPERMHIVIQPNPNGARSRDLFGAERFEIEAETLTDTAIHIAMSATGVYPESEIRVVFSEQIAGGHEQGYLLTIRKDGIEIRARAAAGRRKRR